MYTYNSTIQDRIRQVMQESLNSHPRVSIFRFDLRYPKEMLIVDDSSSDISTFRDLLYKRIQRYVQKKSNDWNRSLDSTFKYTWVREYGSINKRRHYHVLLFLNKDIFYTFGNFYLEESTVASMIRDSWNSAIHNLDYFQSTVNFGKACYISKNDVNFALNSENILEYADYLAKDRDKRHNDGYRNFGSSI